jgi:AcrR family transcriptional regulator
VRSANSRPDTFTRAARRAQIVQSAIEVIAEVGWAQTSIRKVADRVGVAMSAVLYHFGSKDNLVESIIAEMYRTALAVVGPAVEAETNPTAKLAAYIRASVEYFDTHRVHLVALSQIGTGFAPTDGRGFDELGLAPGLRDELETLDPTAILEAGQQSGEFAKLPVDSTATAIRGAVNAVVDRILRDPGYDAQGYADDLVDLMLRAVRR